MKLTQEEVKEQVLESIIEATGCAKEELYNADANLYDDLGCDSLDFVEILMEIEKRLNILLPDEQAEYVVTIKQLLDFVERRYR